MKTLGHGDRTQVYILNFNACLPAELWWLVVTIIIIKYNIRKSKELIPERARFKRPNGWLTRKRLPPLSVVLDSGTFTYRHFAITTNLWHSKILYKQYKWKVRVPINSSHPHEYHGTRINAWFYLYWKPLNKNSKP